MMQKRILELLDEHKNGLTTVEISYLLQTKKINTIRTHLSQLKKMGVVKKLTKRDCIVSGYFSSVYSL